MIEVLTQCKVCVRALLNHFLHEGAAMRNLPDKIGIELQITWKPVTEGGGEVPRHTVITLLRISLTD